MKIKNLFFIFVFLTTQNIFCFDTYKDLHSEISTKGLKISKISSSKNIGDENLLVHFKTEKGHGTFVKPLSYFKNKEKFAEPNFIIFALDYKVTHNIMVTSEFMAKLIEAYEAFLKNPKNEPSCIIL